MSEENKKAKRTNPKHEIFKDEYLKCWNATEAYQRAYPKASRETARRNGSILLTNTDILADIELRLAESAMGADEALKLTADIARGDLAELMDVSSVGFNIDLQEAKKKGMTKLIKRVKQKVTTFIGKGPNADDREIVETEIELYDAQQAARDILKIHGRFTEKLDLSGEVAVKDMTDAEALARLMALAQKASKKDEGEKNG